MPKIEAQEKLFFNLLGKTLTDDQLEKVFPRAKAELDGHDKEKHIIKIELNDTNRPDLWSPAGVARLLKTYETGEIHQYDFFSTPEETRDCEGREIHVGPRAKEVREFSCGFVADGHSVDSDLLKALIQSQEKLCWNFGRKRKSIAMGIYRNNLIKYPVLYDGVDPDKTSFVPLGMDENLTLREICTKHPKGKEYGYIVSDAPVFPFLKDANGDAMSFPPVINSARIGAVEEGDDNLFLEFSGPGLEDLLLCASIMACDMADMGFNIRPVKVVYPYETEFGKEITVPFYYQAPASCSLDDIYRILGDHIDNEEAVASLQRMGVFSFGEDGKIYATCPEYRDDFLHAVDVVEEVMIGHGLENFEPVMPGDFTIGRLSKEEELSRKVKDLLVGMGFQEMIYNYLGSKKEFVDNMHISLDQVVQIANPMSENYEVVRPSIIPSLLGSESVSGHAVYPHSIFECGKIVYPYEKDNSGTVTKNSLGFLQSDASTDFNRINSFINTLMYFLKKVYTLAEPVNEPRFIKGRCANIMVNSKKVGIFGEIHPAVLESWKIGVPTVACEIDLDSLIEQE